VSSTRRRTSSWWGRWRSAHRASPAPLGEVRRDRLEIGPGRVARLDRRARAPARARTRGRRDGRHRRPRRRGGRLHRGVRHAEHRPVTDNQARSASSAAGRRPPAARVYPVGAISVGQKGETLAEFGEMIAAGAVAVSDDGKPSVATHAHRARVCARPSDPGRRALRGDHPRARRRDARGDRLRPARAQGDPGEAEEIHVIRCILSGEAHRRAYPPLPHEHQGLGGAHPLGQGSGAQGHRRGLPRTTSRSPTRRSRGTTPTPR
jgi:hypothetical protein